MSVSTVLQGIHTLDLSTIWSATDILTWLHMLAVWASAGYKAAAGCEKVDDWI